MARPAPRVIVGMSGGVDSSVAALLLLQQGFRVEGLFMKNWEDDDEPGYCAAEEDLKDAQAVCETLEIVLHKVNFAREYWDRVFSHFLEEYRAGRTPNPDILCNREIKFRAFLDYARNLGADHIATGHYARLQHSVGEVRLLKGLDANKDQSYFLYALNQSQLTHALFPVGELRKPRVRELAAEAGLITHDKKDSTGICFIGERRFRDFLARYLPAQPGPIVTPEDEVIGEHHGLMYYTYGQRQGLGIGGIHGADESPWYVAGKDLERNRLLVVQGHEHPLLMHKRLRAGQLTWIADHPPHTPLSCAAKVRYRQADQPCVLSIDKDGVADVVFEHAQRAITPGQSVVFYDGESCLGGGIIQSFYD
ncbi:MAG: tRNA 2-thiouridine(34) synthase MnmA [Gammaproteobacteria bacterium]|jgi:tRNA-specific 2-thiouridylase